MPELNSGPGTGPRPNSSNTTAQSVALTSAPPNCSGSIMPSQPISAAFFTSCGWYVCLFLYHWVIWCAGTSALTKSAATFLNISWVSVRLKSMVLSYDLNVLNCLNGCNDQQHFVQIVQVVQNVKIVSNALLIRLRRFLRGRTA